MQDALIVVDVQNDFCEGGTLAARDTRTVLPEINALVRRYVSTHRMVVFTRDWHPADHSSFTVQGGPWPAHCVRGTSGAEFHPELVIPRAHLLVSKAVEPGEEAYSGFQGTGLAELFKRLGIRNIAICGLTTEYCVHATFNDAHERGFAPLVHENAIRPVRGGSPEERKALEEFRAARGM